MIYLLKIFLSVAFLPLLAWQTLILLIPGLLMNLLTTFELQFANFYQYDSILIPFILIGAVFALEKLLNTNLSKKILTWLILILAGVGFIWNSPLSPLNFPWPKYKNERTQDFRKILELIPSEASVAAHTNLVPRLTHRQDIYMTGREPFFVDYVILDGEDLFGFPAKEDFDKYFNSYKQTGQYELILINNRYYILKKINL